VAVFPDGKNRVVARHQVFSDGSMKPLETWRPIKPEEDRELPNARVISGGVAEVAPEKPGLPWGKIALGVLGTGALLGGGAWLLTREPAEELTEEPEDEEDDADDDEEEDEDEA
jgi:hypothetical protein